MATTDSIIRRASGKVTAAIRNCFKRFPVTVCFLILLSAELSYFIAAEEISNTRLFLIITYYLSAGTLLSLTLHLWSEEVQSKIRKTVVQSAAHLVLLADSVTLYFVTAEKYIMEIGIAHGAAIFSLFLSLFYLSFTREKNDIPSWNFALRTLKSFVTACVLGLIMYSGISLLVLSLNQLFGITIPNDTYRYLAIVCNLLLAGMLFMGLLPQGTAKHDTVPLSRSFIITAARYFFLPLTAAYLLVLYIYGAKILFMWELPVGWVSWLVTILMSGCIIIELCLYPARVGVRGKWDERVARWLPILILPLLLLMTVGIVRRFSDYGITINRLYIITFNIWCYIVCIGLFLTKAKRVSWIPVSFAALFLLTSVLPVNYTSITRQVLHAEIEKSFTRTGDYTLPLTIEEYGKWDNSSTDEEASAINEKLEYMEAYFGRGSVSDLVKEDVTINYLRTRSVRDSNQDTYHYGRVLQGTAIKIPEGYGEFVRIDKYMDNIKMEAESDTMKIPMSEFVDDSTDTLSLDLRPIKRACNTANGIIDPIVAISNTKRHSMAITSFTIKITAGGELTLSSIEGYLFTKQP